MKIFFLLIGMLSLFAHGIDVGIADDKDDKADIIDKPSCIYCGMNRSKFAYSRILIRYDDGSSVGTCSVHCAALDLALFIDKTPIFVGVGDYNTHKLIDAEKAFWVIGGEKVGVMTRRAKWAFEYKQDAEQFLKIHGGVVATLDEVMKATYEDMYNDTRMIREKRRMMRKKKEVQEKK